MKWIINNWMAISGALAVLCIVLVRVRNYMLTNDTTRDDEIGKEIGWIAGLLQAVLGITQKKGNEK
jgi:hypothetical protein